MKDPIGLLKTFIIVGFGFGLAIFCAMLPIVLIVAIGHLMGMK